MAQVLEENKELQASVTDLQVHLTQERHRKEDLEVKVLALEKDMQLLEAENHSLSEQFGCIGDQHKCMTLSLALLVFSVLRYMIVTYNIGDGAWPFPQEH